MVLVLDHMDGAMGIFLAYVSHGRSVLCSGNNKGWAGSVFISGRHQYKYIAPSERY